MGLLDDAIREHLELKRRHGADPTEVARQESEALGPARRAAEPAVAEPEPEPDVVEEPESEPVAFEAAPEPEFFEPEPPRAAPEPEPGPEAEPEPEPPARRIEPDLVDQPTVEHPAARPDALIEDEIFDVDEMPAPAQDDGDVLEGTPEFLEETPEHDRLWFEQRPPRDFDFDD
jgi:hypothetical protein